MRKLLAALLILFPAVAWGQANPWGTTIAPTQSGTTYTVQATDCRLTIPFTSSSPVTVTMPSAGVVGCEVWLLQSGAGTVTAVNGSGATIPNPYPTTATVAQNSIAHFKVTANSGGSAAAWTMQDLSAYAGSGGPSPTITAGTATLDATASNQSGTVTEGAAQTGFTLTFNTTNPFPTTPHCVVSSPNGSALTSYTPSTTTLVVANLTATGSNFTYACFR